MSTGTTPTPGRSGTAPRARPGVDAIVVMGVSGCGKSTVGSALAQRLGWQFADGDDYHPPANVEKMRAGQPLDDSDRAPWLAALNAMLRASIAERRPVVLACSALRQRYRTALAEGMPGLRFVHLDGTPELIGERLAARRHRYMPASLLASQFAALEPPADALRLDVSAAVDALVEAIVADCQSNE